jgi:hypothetical protein
MENHTGGVTPGVLQRAHAFIAVGPFASAAMQPRGAITKFGEFRRKGHAVRASLPTHPARGFSRQIVPLALLEKSLLERAKCKSRKFEAGIQFQSYV